MNTIHFSRAESIGINVVFSPNQVLLEVRSHGVKPRWTQESDENLDEQEISIRRMSYRAHLIGAHFNIVHTSKKATVIHLLLPLTL